MQTASHAAIWDNATYAHTLLIHTCRRLVRLIETEKESTCALDQETSMYGVLDVGGPQMSCSVLLGHGPNVCSSIHKHDYKARIIAVQTPLSLKVSSPLASYPRLRLQDSRRYSKGLRFAASHVMHYRLREGGGGASLWQMGKGIVLM